MTEIKKYPVEAYAWIINIDKSVVELNPVLEPLGYQFIVVGLSQLEKEFSDLVGYPSDFKSTNSYTLTHFDNEVNHSGGNIREAVEKVRREKLESGLTVDQIETTVSGEFYDLIQNNIEGGFEIVFDRHVIFLKKTERFNHEVVDNRTDFASSFRVGKEMSEFVRHLISRMRLFKNGDVMNRTEFHILTDNRKIIKRYKPGYFQTRANTFSILPEEVEAFGQFLNDKPQVNDLTELALSNFNTAYSIADLKSRYLNFMICLESLFNRNATEISHTVSRHLSIILSENGAEFASNYARMKQLYTYRSHIVHGLKLKENLEKITDELQNLVRKAINYCLKETRNKDQFFEWLNSKGF